MAGLHLLEYGKAYIENGKMRGHAQIIVNADGTKPRMIAYFDEKRNELVGELFLVNEWNKNLPIESTIGRNLRQDYQQALKMKKGMFSINSTITDDYNYNICVTFIDSSKQDFKYLTFENILFDSKTNVITIPPFYNDDYDVFLEETLTGILSESMHAAVQRSCTIDFINRMHYAFVLNKFGVCYDQRNRSIEQVC